MEDFSKLHRVIGRMNLDGPSLSFTNNVMRMVETKEVKWSFNYILKHVLPFGLASALFISIFVLNIFNIHIVDIYSIFPSNVSLYLKDYQYYTKIVSYILSSIFGLTLLVKQIKNKLIKI